jgi:hypothetical protein
MEREAMIPTYPGNLVDARSAAAPTTVGHGAVAPTAHPSLHVLLDELGTLHGRLGELQSRFEDQVHRITGSGAVVEGPQPGHPAPPAGQVPMAVDLARGLHMRLNRLEDTIARLATLA